MIPVLVTSCVNRFDLLERMLLSIDEPVGRGLIVDNAMSTGGRRAAARVGLGVEWRVAEPPFLSLGWPGTLNFGIMQTPDAPWWMFANNDIVFAPGSLATIAALMNEAGDRPRVVTHRFSAFAINRAVVDAIGLFDEWSFWPLYYDDQDYAVRCRRAGVELIHGDWGITEGDDGMPSSMTINSDEHHAAANRVSERLNGAAFEAKWGGRPGEETFDTPWDLGLPLWATRPDLGGRVARKW